MEIREIVGICLLSIALVATAVAIFYRGDSEPGSRQYEWEMAEVNPTNIRSYLEELSKEPHMAGLQRDEDLAEWIAEGWRSFGLDYVKVQTYSMLVDYPNSADPNLIRLLDAKGEIVFTSHYKEEGVDDPNFVHAFNAYSKAGTVEGVPLYVNYGSVEDFQYLKDNHGVDFGGKICLTRYGQIFRGNKADNGARFGCAGLIIFSDPAEAAQEGVEPEHVYPKSFWLPGTGVQRGSLSLSDGDPLTPNWPSVEHAYRLDMEERQAALPRIVVQPIGYDDAKEILVRMGGVEAPQDWQGQIPGVTYKIGGEFSPDYQGAKLVVSVNNMMEERNSSNVIGILYGAEEPDRYVMLGNHRDAWGFGAVDPSSGTAQMMEVARVLTEKVKQGWRPRRTIMFLSWGAEEFSLCGSREFVEEYQVQLEDRGVAYINTDICMSGQILEPAASPTLAHLYKEAVKDIYSPTGEGSYWDFWREYEGIPEGEDFNPEVITSPGAGSDHASFIYLAGVPVMDLTFGPDRKKYPNIGGYPLYHTGYETFELVDKIYDPDFTMFRACAQLNLRLGLELSDSELLPLRFGGYADVMEAAMKELDKNGVLAQLSSLGVDTQFLNQSVFQFRSAVEEYESHVADLDKTNQLTLRTLNDQIRGFEKTFLLNPSLPDRPQYRHAVIAPSLFDAYGGSAFPGIGDLLYGIDDPLLSEDDRLLRIKKLKRHISDLMILVQRAAKFLQPVSLL